MRSIASGDARALPFFFDYSPAAFLLMEDDGARLALQAEPLLYRVNRNE